MTVETSTADQLTNPEGFAVPPTEEPIAAAKRADFGPSVNFGIIRRNGKVTNFDANKIAVAMTKAFLAVEGGKAAASSRIHDTVRELTKSVVDTISRRIPEGGQVHIEDVQDQVELALMRGGEHKIARAYVLYREEQKRKRQEEVTEDAEEHLVNVTAIDGSTKPLDVNRLRALISEACDGLEGVTEQSIFDDTCRNLFDGIKEKDVANTLVMSSRTLIEKEPNYSYAAARLLMDSLRFDALGFLGMDTNVATQAEMADLYPSYFKNYVQRAVELELLDPRLAQ